MILSVLLRMSLLAMIDLCLASSSSNFDSVYRMGYVSIVQGSTLTTEIAESALETHVGVAGRGTKLMLANTKPGFVHTDTKASTYDRTTSSNQNDSPEDDDHHLLLRNKAGIQTGITSVLTSIKKFGSATSITTESANKISTNLTSITINTSVNADNSLANTTPYKAVDKTTHGLAPQTRDIVSAIDDAKLPVPLLSRDKHGVSRTSYMRSHNALSKKTDFNRRRKRFYENKPDNEDNCMSWSPKLYLTINAYLGNIEVNYCRSGNLPVPDTYTCITKTNLTMCTSIMQPMCKHTFQNLDAGNYKIMVKPMCRTCFDAIFYNKECLTPQFVKSVVLENNCLKWSPKLNLTIDSARGLIGVDYCSLDLPVPDTSICVMNTDLKKCANIVQPQCHHDFKNLSAGNYTILVQAKCNTCPDAIFYNKECLPSKHKRFVVLDARIDKETPVPNNTPNVWNKETVAVVAAVGAGSILCTLTLLLVAFVTKKYCFRNQSPNVRSINKPISFELNRMDPAPATLVIDEELDNFHQGLLPEDQAQTAENETNLLKCVCSRIIQPPSQTSEETMPKEQGPACSRNRQQTSEETLAKERSPVYSRINQQPSQPSEETLTKIDWSINTRQQCMNTDLAAIYLDPANSMSENDSILENSLRNRNQPDEKLTVSPYFRPDGENQTVRQTTNVSNVTGEFRKVGMIFNIPEELLVDIPYDLLNYNEPRSRQRPALAIQELIREDNTDSEEEI